MLSFMDESSDILQTILDRWGGYVCRATFADGTARDVQFQSPPDGGFEWHGTALVRDFDEIEDMDDWVAVGEPYTINLFGAEHGARHVTNLAMY